MGISVRRARQLAKQAATGREAEVQKIPTIGSPNSLYCIDETDYLREVFKFHWKIVTGTDYPFKPEEYVVAGRHFKFDDYYIRFDTSGLTARPDVELALEFDGKVHMNEDRWERDHEKFAIAAHMGVLVVPLTYKMLHDDPHRWVKLVWEMIR